MPRVHYLLFGREPGTAYGAGRLGATDWVDGYLARHLGQVSEMGKVLDPVADRLLFIVGGGGILVDGAVPRWFGLVVLVREVLVGGTTLVLAALGARRIDVTWWGKAGTFALMISFPLFLASHSTLGWADTARVLAWVAGSPGWPSACSPRRSTCRWPAGRWPRGGPPDGSASPEHRAARPARSP